MPPNMAPPTKLLASPFIPAKPIPADGEDEAAAATAAPGGSSSDRARSIGFNVDRARSNSLIIRSNSMVVRAARGMSTAQQTAFIALLSLALLGVLYRTTSPLLSDGSSKGGHPPVSWGGRAWEQQVLRSGAPQKRSSLVVLVTGAAGFVGSHACLALRRRGDGVVGLDNFNSYYPVELKRARQERLAEEGIFIVEGDISDQALLLRLFDLIQFTHVLHLAAQAGVRYAVHNPLAYVHSNVAGFVTLLEQCKSSSPQPAVVFASSSSIYGLNTKVPFSEDDRTDRPASLYAATKKSDELLAHTYNHIYGLSITALRFFTVYGPWGRPDMAYFSFARNIVEGKPILIFHGPQHQQLARDFTFIDDVVQGCLAALDTAGRSTGNSTGSVTDTVTDSVTEGVTGSEEPAAAGKKRRRRRSKTKAAKAPLRVFNLGNTRPVTVGDFVSMLENHLGTKAIREYIQMPATGDVMFTHANITRANRELNYHPTTDLNTGLDKFVQWYRSYYRQGSGNAKTLEDYTPY